MFTKTQAKIMEIFVSRITGKFSIRGVAEELKLAYPLIHRSMQSLLLGGFLLKDERGLISLNYGGNHGELAYVESLRAKGALAGDKTIDLFVKDVLERLKEDFFVFLIFGSFVEKKDPRDIDVLIILDDEKKINDTEKVLVNIAGNFTKKFEFQVISSKSAQEMLAKRDKINILNETLNKHILLFGAENYYRIIKNAR
ncbi:MAG: hypothetical protein WCK90_01210 [archaeon]